jgi:hypothetical protein
MPLIPARVSLSSVNITMNSGASSDNTMIFGLKVKVDQSPSRSKTYLSVGLLCMFLSLFFHITGNAYQTELISQMTGQSRPKVSPEMQAWIQTCSSLSFVTLWIAVVMLFQASFQHRKAIQNVS